MTADVAMATRDPIPNHSAMREVLRRSEFQLRYAERFARKARGAERQAWEKYCDELRQLPARGLPVEWPTVSCEVDQ